MQNPTLVSLFSGAGGLDVGLENAGFDTLVATDFDPDCVESLRTNRDGRTAVSGSKRRSYLKHAHIVSSPVQDLTTRDLRPDGVGRRWTPDLLAGGPPCQPFSSAGRMLSVDDPRGRLFEHFVRLADGLRPRMIVFENVRGLVTARGCRGESGEALGEVKRAFEEIGYATSFELLNAADFGSPQRRVRLFMLACRQGSPPEFPSPTHRESLEGSLFEEPAARWVTLGEFLSRRGSPRAADIVRPSPRLEAALASVQAGSGLRSPGARETTRPGGHWGYKQGTFIADPSLPARTVTAASTQDWIRCPDGSLRRLTWRECAALQGFPPAWQFAGNAVSRFRQIGNAVPVVFGEVLGRSLLRALRSQERGRFASAPLPRHLVEAIGYTEREHRRNGDSRRQTLQKIAAGGDPRTLKGIGNASTKIA